MKSRNVYRRPKSRNDVSIEVSIRIVTKNCERHCKNRRGNIPWGFETDKRFAHRVVTLTKQGDRYNKMVSNLQKKTTAKLLRVLNWAPKCVGVRSMKTDYEVWAIYMYIKKRELQIERKCPKASLERSTLTKLEE